MKYLLDTCTVSDFVKGELGVLQKIKAIQPSLLAVSSLTRMEINYSLAINPQRAKKLLPMLDAFFSVVITLPFDEKDASASADIRAVLRAKGTPIGPYDSLIAGTGKARNLIVVTANTGEFERVDGLQVENWRNLTK